MKKMIFAAALATATLTAQAQQRSVPRTYNNPSALINVGVGLSNWGIPVYGSVEGFAGDFTLGGALSYRRYHDNWRAWQYNVSGTTASFIANYHFNRIMRLPSDWDFYLGANVGYYFENYAGPHGAPEYGAHRVGGLAAGLQLGGRYYFSRSAGINLEIGGGNVLSDARLGITFRL